MKKRTGFVSNSSSSSFVVDSETFTSHFNNKKKFQLNYKTDKLYSYMKKYAYDFDVKTDKDYINLFYDNVKDDAFSIISDKDYIQKYTHNDDNCLYIPESLKEYRDKFIKCFNDIVNCKDVLKEKNINYYNDEQYTNLRQIYCDLLVQYRKDVCVLMEKNLDNIEVILCRAFDDCCTVKYYDNDEQYLYDAIHAIYKNAKFYRIYNEH